MPMKNYQKNNNTKMSSIVSESTCFMLVFKYLSLNCETSQQEILKLLTLEKKVHISLSQLFRLRTIPLREFAS